MAQAFWIAVKGVIVNPENKILIVSKKNEENPKEEEYNIPWGKLQFWEKIEDGLKREIKEELGIDVKVGKPIRTRGFVKNNFHMVGVTFFARFFEGELHSSNKNLQYSRKSKKEISEGNLPQRIKNEVKQVYLKEPAVAG